MSNAQILQEALQLSPQITKFSDGYTFSGTSVGNRYDAIDAPILSLTTPLGLCSLYTYSIIKVYFV